MTVARDRPPVITSVTPNAGQQGKTVSVAVTGQFTHFSQAATQVNFGAGITVSNVVVSSATSLTAQLEVTNTTVLGSRSLTVTTTLPDRREVATLNNAFTVTPGTPVLTLINPNTGKQGDTLTVQVSGQFTNFVQGTTVANFGAGITASAPTVTTPTSLSVQLTIAAAALAGKRNVTMTTGMESPGPSEMNR